MTNAESVERKDRSERLRDMVGIALLARILSGSVYGNKPQSAEFILINQSKMADRQGFEPWVPLLAQRFSRPPRSTTPASVRTSRGLWSMPETDMPVRQSAAISE